MTQKKQSSTKTKRRYQKPTVEVIKLRDVDGAHLGCKTCTAVANCGSNNTCLTIY